MLTTKSFFRKTKGGNIFKVVREHYLRDDIWCGSEACNDCFQGTEYSILEDNDENFKCKSSIYPNIHYLLLDTNIVLDQIHILEEDRFSNVIITHTVLDEVRHRSSAVYKKLREILEDPSRKFYVFVNEHHKDTYVERELGESPNDRNDRAIRMTAKWYNEHLSKQNVKIMTILLTDDAKNKEKAVQEGIPAETMLDYVSSLENPGHILDKLCRNQFPTDNDAKEPLFPCHLGNAEIHEGIKKGELMQGSFLASRENFLEGSVNVEGTEKPILVQGTAGLNRAVDGDTVAVRLLPENQWTAPSDIVLQDEVEEDPGDILEDETVLKEKSETKIDKIPTGLIVGIIRRKWRQYCGIIQPTPLKDKVGHLFIPAERKIPKVRIETRQYETLSNQRIIVAIDSWPRYSRYPLGHFVRALGEIGDKETENEVLLLEHDVPHSRFSDDVLSFLPKLPWVITDDDVSKRVDLRHLDICSVDPPGCTDIDDALHCHVLENGNFEVGVHIADVSHFIRPGTALDEEAASRATTVYLVDKRIDMVPELLSSNLCSLRGGEERFAFSVIWEIDNDANVVSAKFFKSIIRSKQAMTYEEAQLKIDDTMQQDNLSVSLRHLNNLAKKIKIKRFEKGALSLASPEIRFRIDSETHDPIEVQAKQLRETNSMVEEFMLLANVSVAEKILQEFPECAMLRRHPEPPPTNFDPLVAAGKYQGFEINISSGKELGKSLEAAHKKDNPYFNTMLKILATRCMMQAVYFTSGMFQTNEYFHYGLACPIYTHFTSPIRRYADIIVHRLLAVCVGADSTYPDLLDKKKSHALCHNLNYRNRMAQYAARASVALNTHLFFRGKVQDEDGYILFVRKNALQILIPKFGLEGTLLLSKKGEKSVFVHNEEEHTQTCGDVVFRSFDQIIVQLSLDRTNVQRERLVFKLVKPEIPGFSVPPVAAVKEILPEVKEISLEEKDSKNPVKRKLEKDEKPKKKSKKGKK